MIHQAWMGLILQLGYTFDFMLATRPSRSAILLSRTRVLSGQGARSVERCTNARCHRLANATPGCIANTQSTSLSALLIMSARMRTIQGN